MSARRDANASAPRPRTSTTVAVLAILGAVLGLVSLSFGFSLTWGVRLVWLAVLGLFLGGAAWIRAALVGSRKRWGMLAVLACVLGIAVPVATTVGLLHRAQALEQAENSAAAQESQGYDESAAASARGADVGAALPPGSSQIVAGQQLTVTRVDLDATASVLKQDPTAGAPDGRYVTAALELTNTSGSAVDPALTLAADLVLADGATSFAATSCTADLDHDLLDVGTLKDGASATAQVCFDVPASVSTQELEVGAVRLSDANDPASAEGYWSTTG